MPKMTVAKPKVIRPKKLKKSPLKKLPKEFGVPDEITPMPKPRKGKKVSM